MPTVIAHGAGCCGMRHMRGFGGPGSWPPAERTTDADIKRLIAYFGGPDSYRGKCIEAVITDPQFRNQPDLAQIMADNGFKIVSRFYNSSGSICNVLHRISGKRDIKHASRRNTFLRPLMEA